MNYKLSENLVELKTNIYDLYNQAQIIIIIPSKHN